MCVCAVSAYACVRAFVRRQQPRNTVLCANASPPWAVRQGGVCVRVRACVRVCKRVCVRVYCVIIAHNVCVCAVRAYACERVCTATAHRVKQYYVQMQVLRTVHPGGECVRVANKN
jgi:hypothetical protein